MVPLLPVHEALSGILGSISIACWIFVLVPQLFENYRLKSAEAVSLAFLFTWFVGDVTNLVGAIWAELVPTVVALAIYFCIADFVLLFQCLYYRYLMREDINGADDPSRQPLLDPGQTEDLQSTNGSTDSQDNSVIGRRSETEKQASSLFKRKWLSNSIAILTIFTMGLAGWAVAWLAGVWQPSKAQNTDRSATQPLEAMILGYISAFCYLSARLPQIFKNFRDKSCEGLSLLFFVLSLLGNLTYGGGILFHSLERGYILTNLPWLLGSLGTMVEDIAIFFQFHIYAPVVERSNSLDVS